MSAYSDIFRKPRRLLHWDRVRGPKAVSAVAIGTAFGAGLAPVAPGTMGSLVGLPIAYFAAEWTLEAKLALWSAITLAGTWACKEFDELMQSHDNQNLVIDEVVGVGLTALTLTQASSGWAWFAALVLFRFFDIVKPPPVRQVDRWSKTGSAWMGGFGVMADDIVAGFQGLAVMLALRYFNVL